MEALAETMEGIVGAFDRFLAEDHKKSEENRKKNEEFRRKSAEANEEFRVLFAEEAVEAERVAAEAERAAAEAEAERAAAAEAERVAVAATAEAEIAVEAMRSMTTQQEKGKMMMIVIHKLQIRSPMAVLVPIGSDLGFDDTDLPRISQILDLGFVLPQIYRFFHPQIGDLGFNDADLPQISQIRDLGFVVLPQIGNFEFDGARRPLPQLPDLFLVVPCSQVGDGARKPPRKPPELSLYGGALVMVKRPPRKLPDFFLFGGAPCFLARDTCKTVVATRPLAKPPESAENWIWQRKPPETAVDLIRWRRPPDTAARCACKASKGR